MRYFVAMTVDPQGDYILYLAKGFRPGGSHNLVEAKKALRSASIKRNIPTSARIVRFGEPIEVCKTDEEYFRAKRRMVLSTL